MHRPGRNSNECARVARQRPKGADSQFTRNGHDLVAGFESDRLRDLRIMRSAADEDGHGEPVSQRTCERRPALRGPVGGLRRDRVARIEDNEVSWGFRKSDPQRLGRKLRGALVVGRRDEPISPIAGVAADRPGVVEQDVGPMRRHVARFAAHENAIGKTVRVEPAGLADAHRDLRRLGDASRARGSPRDHAGIVRRTRERTCQHAFVAAVVDQDRIDVGNPFQRLEMRRQREGVDVVKAAVKRASNDRRDQRVSDSAARAVEQGPAHVFGRATGSRINSRV